MSEIWIRDYPLPPSVNQYLMPVRNRLVKTKIHRQYQDLCFLWGAQNRTIVSEIQGRCRDAMNDVKSFGSVVFRVDVYFAFEQSRVFTIDWKIQQLDRDNRLKPVQDTLSKVLQIDDRYFFAGNCEKVTCSAKEQECALIRISAMKPRTLTEILAMSRPSQGS